MNVGKLQALLANLDPAILVVMPGSDHDYHRAVGRLTTAIITPDLGINEDFDLELAGGDKRKPVFVIS